VREHVHMQGTRKRPGACGPEAEWGGTRAGGGVDGSIDRLTGWFDLWV
jgi:hypothetical protein